ncbi:unnamed protein product [Caenorhabditis nigoni]
MAKILGEGHVRKTGRACVILEKSKNVLVDLPESAFRLNYDKKWYEPEHGDHLIFSAQLQNGRYSAVTAIRQCDLLQTYGSLSYFDDQLKFGHVSIQGRTAKVFVPFSTRTTNGACWYGQGAYIDKPYLIHMFRQEESHGCKYVAWAIFDDNRKTANAPAQSESTNVSHMKKLGTTNAVQRQSDHQSVEFVKSQTGVIYDVSDNFVVSVTSPTCQNVEFAPALFESWMRPGRFMTFDGRRVSDVKTSKLMGSNPEDMGSIYPIRKLAPLTITISAVFNKVSHGKAGWAWNDHVGRIYVPWNCTDRHMSASKPLPFTPVHLEIAYNGKHDDIPWVASSASLCEELEFDQVIDENARMLKTEDNWKIASIVDGPDNPSIFLQKLDESGKKKCAFAKVIDLNSGNIPPTGTLVRITYYAQERHGRHAFRCVLVTSMDKVERIPKVHLVHNGVGVKHFPMLYEQPIPKKQKVTEPAPRIQAAPPPPKNCWNMKNLGAPAVQPSAQDFPTVDGSEIEEKENIPTQSMESLRINSDESIPAVVSKSAIEPPPGLEALPRYSAHPANALTLEELEASQVSAAPLPPRPSYGLRMSMGSMWSGTPAESKPEELTTFFPQETFVNTTLGQFSSAFTPSGDNFFTELATVSQPSTSSAVNSNPISDLRNTQSEASSPGLKSDINEQSEEQGNCWSAFDNNTFGGSFSFGFPHVDLPIYQSMIPKPQELLKITPTAETDADAAPSTTDTNADSCTCGNEQLIWDLWENPRFVAAFSASDPETYRRVEARRQTFSSVHRH